MSMKRPPLSVLPGIAVALLAVFLFGRWLFSSDEPAMQYITAPVVRGDISDTVLASGTIRALRQVDVGAQESGQIQNLAVTLGQTVKTGDLIAEIDPRTQQNALRNAEAALNSYRAQLRVKQASLTKAQLDYRREKQMLADDATSQENVDNARAALDIAEAEITQLQAQIEQSAIVVETAKINLGYTRIVAPIDGVVVSVPVEAGQTVNANQTTPTLVTLAQLDTVTIRAEIAEGDITRVRPGMPASFTILGEPDQRYQTTLRAIDPGPQSLSDSSTSKSSTSSGSSSSSSSTAIYYYGLLDVPNPDGKLRIDMTAQVSIQVAEARQVKTIPVAALSAPDADGRVTVEVLGRGNSSENNRPEKRQVQIGLKDAMTAEILSGLEEGEDVILGQGAPGTGSMPRRRGALGI